MGQSSKSNRIYGSTGIWNLGLVSTCARDLLRLQQPRCFEKSSRRSGNCSHPRLKPTASRCPASRVETIESNIVGIESKTNSFGPMGLGACTIHTTKGAAHGRENLRRTAQIIWVVVQEESFCSLGPFATVLQPPNFLSATLRIIMDHLGVFSWHSFSCTSC